MPPPASIAKRIWDIFSRPTPPLRVKFSASPQVPPLPGLTAADEIIRDFSAFIPAHMTRVKLVKKEMEKKVGSAASEDQGLMDALDFFESLFDKENPDLLLCPSIFPGSL
jgi:hypothetical protein